MVKRVVTAATTYLITAACCSLLAGQPFAGYTTSAGRNPAFAGAVGDGTLRMFYSSIYPGSGYNLNRIHLSYDTYSELVRGGVGFSVDSDHPGGLMDDIRGRAIYAYHLQASGDLFFFGGLSAGLIYRSFRQGSLIFPDQIDPVSGAVLPGGGAVPVKPLLLFDMGAGLLAEYRGLVVSVAADHLPVPDISGRGMPGGSLERLFTLQAHYNHSGRDEITVLTPYAGISGDGSSILMSAGGAFRYDMVSVSLMVSGGDKITSARVGLSLSGSRISCLYSFSFSTSGAMNGIPFALMHQVGIRTGLNIVDKRYSVRTIFFPDL